MITFLLILILVFLLVDVLVLGVIEPLAYMPRSKKSKAQKTSVSVEEKFPELGLVGATMYDGGKKDETDNKTKEEIKK
jgi:hypothetical protein